MKFVAGNWKMQKTRSEAKEFLNKATQFHIPNKTRAIIAPSPTLLECSVESSRGSAIEIFSQNCHWEDSGAFTGEISPLQLKELGVKGTLVGHSERRQYFGETNETCVKRCAAARKHQLEVIFCIGETQQEREARKTEKVLESQLTGLLKELASDPTLIIAYEPVWAIGTGLTASVEQVRETHAWIHSFLAKNNAAWPILYGGSVKPSNFGSLSELPHVAGGLIGGASLEAESFQELLNSLTH